jgi:hypothetical protein
MQLHSETHLKALSFFGLPADPFRAVGSLEGTAVIKKKIKERILFSVIAIRLAWRLWLERVFSQAAAP